MKKYYLWRIFYRNKYKFPLLFWILLLEQIKNFLRNLMYSVSSKNLHLLKITLWYYPSVWRLPWETMVSKSFCIYYRNIIKDVPTCFSLYKDCGKILTSHKHSYNRSQCQRYLFLFILGCWHCKVNLSLYLVWEKSWWANSYFTATSLNCINNQHIYGSNFGQLEISTFFLINFTNRINSFNVIGFLNYGSKHY